MKLEKLVNECIDALQEQANEDWYPDWDNHDTLGVTINTDDGYIDLSYYYDKHTRFWECEAVVCHDDDEEKNSPNLERFLTEELSDCVDWTVCEDEYRYATMDEWQEHGFRDEADFWHWKEGR